MDSYLGKGVVLIDHRTGAVHGRDAIVAAAAARAGELRGCGVARLDRVVIGHGSDSAVLVDLLAIWSLGAAAVMVSKSITASEKDNVLKAARAKAWIEATNVLLIGSINADEANRAPRCPTKNPAAPAGYCNRGWYTFRYSRSMHSTSSTT